jgi:hypothetical protein
MLVAPLAGESDALALEARESTTLVAPSAGESDQVDDVADDVDEEDDVDKEDDVDEEDDVEVEEEVESTRSGRAIARPTRCREIGATATKHYEIGLTVSEQSSYQAIEANGYERQKQDYYQAMEENGYELQKHRVWKTVLREGIPNQAKILTSTWAMKKKAKKKASGVYRARLNARGYEQIDGVHYDSHSISAPVTNDVAIRTVDNRVGLVD